MKFNKQYFSGYKIIVASILIFLISSHFSLIIGQNNDWYAPTSADLIKPSIDLKGAKNIKAGDKLFHQFCAICHGKKGKGDGIAGMALKPKPNNLTNKKTQEQSNGAIYWKITEGNPPMASYKTTLTDIQRWELVAYIKTLDK